MVKRKDKSYNYLIPLSIIIGAIIIASSLFIINEFDKEYNEEIININLDEMNYIENIQRPIANYICTENVRVSNYQNAGINSDSFFIELINRNKTGSCALLVRELRIR